MCLWGSAVVLISKEGGREVGEGVPIVAHADPTHSSGIINSSFTTVLILQVLPCPDWWWLRQPPFPRCAPWVHPCHSAGRHSTALGRRRATGLQQVICSYIIASADDPRLNGHTLGVLIVGRKTRAPIHAGTCFQLRLRNDRIQHC